MTEWIYEQVTLDIPLPADVTQPLAERGRVGGDLRFVIGESPEESDAKMVEVYSLTKHLPVFASAIEPLLSGDEVCIEIYDSKSYLTPLEDRDAVRVGLGIDVGTDELYFEDGVVDTEALIVELYTTLQEWYQESPEVNPDIQDLEWYQELENELEAAERAMVEAGIEFPS